MIMFQKKKRQIHVGLYLKIFTIMFPIFTELIALKICLVKKRIRK